VKSFGTTDRLVQLFERELRALDNHPADLPVKRPSVRLSQELERQIAQYAGDVRTHGHTAEQMLVELKGVLARVAPDVPSTQRMQLVSELTTQAIDAFFRT
jgi:hypothetical protein